MPPAVLAAVAACALPMRDVGREVLVDVAVACCDVEGVGVTGEDEAAVSGVREGVGITS